MTAGDGEQAIASLRLQQRAVPDRIDCGIEAGHLVLHVANQQRNVGGQRGGVGGKRIAGQNVAVHHGAEGVTVEQRPLRRTMLLGRRADDGQQLFCRQALQLRQVVPRDTELLQHDIRQLRRPLGAAQHDGGAALDDRFVEQAACQRHGHQRRNLPAAAGLAKDRDVSGVAAE